MTDSKLRILLIGAHPDDCEVKCGGTAALWAQAGNRGQLPIKVQETPSSALTRRLRKGSIANMPRVARTVIPSAAHHITHRGNNRQDVFFVDDDRRTYLAILEQQSKKFGLLVQGYCLMTNHVHLLATPKSEASLAKAVGRTHLLYTQYINRLHGRSGHLWQNRFFSCPLDEPHFWQALCYVERNPVRAKMVRVAWAYRWSSAAGHTGHRHAAGLLGPALRQSHFTPSRWKQHLRRPEDNQAIARLRLRTHTGRPLASDNFVTKLEGLLGRRLRPLAVGRPPKPRKDQRGKHYPTQQTSNR